MPPSFTSWFPASGCANSSPSTRGRRQQRVLTVIPKSASRHAAEPPFFRMPAQAVVAVPNPLRRNYLQFLRDRLCTATKVCAAIRESGGPVAFSEVLFRIKISDDDVQTRRLTAALPNPSPGCHSSAASGTCDDVAVPSPRGRPVHASGCTCTTGSGLVRRFVRLAHIA